MRKIWKLLALLAALSAAALLSAGLAEGEAADLPVLRSDPCEELEDGVELETEEERSELPPALGGAYARDQILSVSFEASLSGAPEDAWDVSEAGDGSVLAWVEPVDELYALTIAGEGGVRAPENCADLFYYYENLETVQFNGCFDTSPATDMSRMFGCCWALEELNLSGFDTANVTDMSGMFNCCTSLLELDLSGFDTANVTDMSWMFESCNCLEDLDLSGFDTSRVENMDCMFEWCGCLMDLDLSGFRTPKLESMDQMFYGCSGLTSLDLGGFETLRIEDMSRLFSSCYGLRELDLTSFDTSGAANMDEMFSNCGALEVVRVSERFQMLPGALDAFKNCPIESVTLVEDAPDEAEEEESDEADEESDGADEEAPDSSDGAEEAGAEDEASDAAGEDVLQQGDRGDDVTKLQQALIDAGALSDVADGIFGPKTEAAVRAMQERLGVEPTGIADREFLERLYAD